MVAAVAIMLSVAVDVAGGESVRSMFVLQDSRYVVAVAAVRVVVVHVALGGGVPLYMLFLLLLSLSQLLSSMDHRGFVVTRVRFAVPDQKVGIADPESPDAATGFLCSLTPCDVVLCCSCCCCCYL